MKRLRIAVDARSLNTPFRRGIGRYLFEILSRMQTQLDASWLLLGDRPDVTVEVPASLSAEVEVFEMRGDRFQAWEQIGLPLKAKRFGADVLFCPANRAPIWQPMPVCVTIHDTMEWDGIDGSVPGLYLDRVAPVGLSRAQRVITISRSSKEDILRRFPRIGSRVEVIPHGVDEDFLAGRFDSAMRSPAFESLELDKRPGPYLVYVGGTSPRKRLRWALERFAQAARPDATLIVCGIDAKSHASVIREHASLVDSRVRFAGYLSQQDLIRIYSGASALLYPTTYEGFGLPALEAQACGTRVLMSPVGSLRDLVGPSVESLPIDDAVAWNNAIASALDAGPSASLRGAASAWASRFSWQSSAASHAASLRSCGQGHGG